MQRTFLPLHGGKRGRQAKRHGTAEAVTGEVDARLGPESRLSMSSGRLSTFSFWAIFVIAWFPWITVHINFFGEKGSGNYSFWWIAAHVADEAPKAAPTVFAVLAAMIAGSTLPWWKISEVARRRFDIGCGVAGFVATWRITSVDVLGGNAGNSFMRYEAGSGLWLMLIGFLAAGFFAWRTISAPAAIVDPAGK